MSISRTVAEQLAGASWIRRMFEEGARLKRELGPENVFDFTLGNPDIPPPEPVHDALETIARERRPGAHGYMPNAGLPWVREVVARHLAHRTGLPFTPDHVLMTVGSAGACNTFLRAVLDPGDEVIVLAPWFPEYTFYIQNHGGRMAIAETSPELLPDPDRIAAAITPRTKVIILNSPNNPTGRVYPARILAEIAGLLSRIPQPIYVLSDEAYAGLVFDGRRHPEAATYIQRTVIAGSWSKSFAIAGERIGYLAISPGVPEARELIEACVFAHRILGYVNAPALWQRVVAAAIHAAPDVATYQKRRDLICDALENAGYKLIRPEGTFYVFPRSPIPDDLAFIRVLLAEGILAVPGAGFGRPGYFRLSLTLNEEAIRAAIPRFERALAKARGQ